MSVSALAAGECAPTLRRQWFRQLKALLKKQATIRRRPRCGLLCEVCGPVLAVVFLMLLLGVSVDTTTFDSTLRLRDDTTTSAEATQAAEVMSACMSANPSSDDVASCDRVGVMGNQLVQEGRGTVFNASSNAAQLFARSDKNNLGLERMHTLQFLPAVASDAVLTAAVALLADAVRQRHPVLAPLVRTDFKDEATLESTILGSSYGLDEDQPRVAMAVVLQSASPVWAYSLRGTTGMFVNHSNTLLTAGSTIDFESLRFEAGAFPVLLERGTHLLQEAVEQFIIEAEWSAASGANARAPGSQLRRQFYLQPFPTPAITSGEIKDGAAQNLVLVFVLSMLAVVMRIVGEVVDEKERRVKDVMLSMGVHNSALTASWFITYLVIFAVMAAGFAQSTHGLVFNKSNGFYLWSFFFFYAMSTWALCWMLAVFFRRADMARTGAALIFMALSFGYFAASGGSASRGAKGVACLASPLCFGMGAETLLAMQALGSGVTASTASRAPYGLLSFNTVMGMLALDFVICLALAWYFEQVLPSEYGTHKKPWFLCTRQYWRPEQDIAEVEPLRVRSPPPAVDASSAASPSCFEASHVIPGAEPAIRVSHLRKTFHVPGQPEQVAVSDLSLDLYEGEIFVLLGHNGAGKSTAISMLTGFLPPSSGDATVHSLSLRDNLPQIRTQTGVCPQSNSHLFDQMTVREHLVLYAAFKLIAPDQIDAAVDAMLADVGLVEKQNEVSAALSGGQKRKLALALALLGDSKVVYLDEPTSGMDPYSRRSTWELLRKKKQGRVIVLTTHFMDEADVLGDRIGIMSTGELKCCGSSLFLKRLYGVGYTLTLSKQPNFAASTVNAMLNASIPGVQVLSDAAGEASYRLPFESSEHFAPVFDRFDAEQQALGIDTYSISVTTLEEVFLRVGHEHEQADSGKALRRSSSSSEDADVKSKRVADSHEYAPAASIDAKPHEIASIAVEAPSLADDLLLLRPAPVSAWAQYVRHVGALLRKRFLHARRDRQTQLWTIGYPVIILLIGCGVLVPPSGTITHVNLGIEPASLQQNGMYAVPAATGSVSSSGNTVVPLFDESVFGATWLPLGDGAVASASTPFLRRTAVQQWLLGTLDPKPAQEYSRFVALDSHLESDGAGGFALDSTLYFNQTAQFSSLLAVNTESNLLLRALTGSSRSIHMSLHPLPAARGASNDVGSITNALTAIIVSLALAFVPASFVSYSLRESELHFKHQQLLAGVRPAAYWTANFIFDLCSFVVVALLALLIFRIWSIHDFIDGSNAGATLLVLLTYALSVIPFCYLVGFACRTSSAAQSRMLLLVMLFGGLLVLAILVLSFFDLGQAVLYVKMVLRELPPYACGEALVNMLVKGAALAFSSPKQTWEMDIVGWPLVFMSVEFFVYSALVLIVETVRTSATITHAKMTESDLADLAGEDADVRRERERLQEASQQHQSGDASASDAIQIRGLRKVYNKLVGGGQKVAVRDLWLGVPQGQCLGFLGINGAGKTTTLSMLSGDVLPTSGTALLGGYDILSQQSQVRKLIGSCPQYDALLPELTARETLTLFARLRGIDEPIVESYVENLLLRLGLQEGQADRPCDGYSGGNKRKLCLAIALIGNPPIVTLDEPSSGMDPHSRRVMWNLISSTMQGRSVILTTHVMEECEALCDQVGIMVGGRLRCLGSPSHLKAVHGSNFQLDVSVPAGAGQQDAFAQAIKQQWSEAQCIEAHGQALKWRIPRVQNQGASGAASPAVNVSIGSVFRWLEREKVRLGVSEYSASETSLEQVFMHFAAEQEEETTAIAGVMRE